MLSRSRIDELMDNPGLDPEEHRQALTDLSRLNTFSRSAGILWTPIQKLCKSKNLQKITMLDVATGSGDVLFSILKLAGKNGIDIQASGCDISSIAIQAASSRAHEEDLPANFFCLDAVNEPLPDTYDIVCISLFTHHLDDEEVVLLLRNARRAAKHLVLVNDLVRSPINWCMVYAATRIFSRSHIVHFDGPASVHNSFTVREMRALALQAGLSGHKVRSRFPCRMLLQWSAKDGG